MLLVVTAIICSDVVEGADGWNIFMPVVAPIYSVPRRTSARVTDKLAVTPQVKGGLWRGYAPPVLPWSTTKKVKRAGPMSSGEGEAMPVGRDQLSPAPRHSVGIFTVPPVVVDLSDDAAPVLPKKSPAIPARSRSETSAAPAEFQYRADAIDSVAPPPKKLPRASQPLDDVAKNALHLVRVEGIAATPLLRTGPLHPGAVRRLERLNESASRESIEEQSGDSAAEVNQAATSHSSPRATAIDQAESIPVNPLRTGSIASSFAALAQEATGPAETLPTPGERAPPRSPSRLPEGSQNEPFKPIQAVTIGIAPSPGELPEDVAKSRFAIEQTLPHVTGYSRQGVEAEFYWEAPALCHRPLFFEEVNLERHGHQVRFAQPLLSAAHFFSRVPAVPYLMLSQKQRICNYTLGHYRPGSFAPQVWYYPNFSLDGAALEAALITGLMFAIP